MPILEVKNRAYQGRIERAIADAIFRASLTEDGSTSVMLSGEIVQACLNTIALMAGTSEATDSPTKARQFADECATALRGRVRAVREQRAAGGLDFITVISADARH